MGVTMIMRMIDPAVAEQISRAPETADDVLLPKAQGSGAQPAPQPKASGGLFSFFKKKEPQPPSQPQVLVDWNKVYHVPDVLDLDRAFEGLHYLLTNGALPFEDDAENWWICPGNGHHVGTDADPEFLIPTDQVAPFLKAVQAMDEAVMRARFDPEKMCDMPIEWTDDPEGNFQYLLKYRNELAVFLQKAQAQNKALLSGVLV